MTVEFRVDKDERIVYGTLTGEVDVDQVLAGLKGMVENEDYNPGFNGITDLRGSNWESDQGDLRKLVHFLIEHRKKIGKSHSAIVVQDDRAYGMSRMFEVFSEQAPVRVRVFRDYDKALKWIRGEEDSEE